MPGQVMECSVFGNDSVLLGCVMPCSKDRIHKRAEFDLIIFQPLLFTSGMKWVLTPVNSFIGPCRQFEACTGNPEAVSFLQSLLGHKQYSSEEACGVKEVMNDETTRVVKGTTAATEEPLFTVPILNESQEIAVSSFLKSPAKSISIVQGYVTHQMIAIFFQ